MMASGPNAANSRMASAGDTMSQRRRTSTRSAARSEAPFSTAIRRMHASHGHGQSLSIWATPSPMIAPAGSPVCGPVSPPRRLWARTTNSAPSASLR
jgi:hypothetical protein